MKRVFQKTLLTLIVLLLFSIALHAGEEARIALVIGNGDYDALGRLNNPPNDARDMADALEDVGFDVDLRIDADLDSMEEAVVEFGRRLASELGATGFFFYAGHGVESDGSNYLIPSGASIRSESFLRTRSVATQAVLDEMQSAGAGLSIVVLDACRDNPFSWARSGSRGLAPVGYQPPGSIVAYATSAGSVAEDGTGRNGTFTAELLNHIGTPGIDISEVFRRTGRAVRDVTAGRQIPAVYNQFFDSAFLGGPPEDPDDEAAAAAEPADPIAAQPEPTPDEEPSAGFGFAVDEADVRVSVNAAATIFVDGVEMTSLDAGESTTLSGIEVGLRTVAARYADEHTETTSVTLEAGETAEASFTYGFGSIRVRVATEGTVYLGDVEVGRLSGGQSATVRGVGSGRHEVVVHYDNGERETSRVTVRPDSTVTAEFTRVFGDVRVSTVAAGTVLIDGDRWGSVGADDSVTLTGVEEGSTVELRSPDGRSDSQTVDFAHSGERVVTVTLEPAFRIGGRGPAGGIVFYDKGRESDGWRYLEAWTADEVGSNQWKTSRTETPGTSTAIGSGYRNTYTAMAGTQHPAAEVVRNATHGGYTDWFLPSKDELNLMHENLHDIADPVGGFASGSYWSSSEGRSYSAWYQDFRSGAQGGNRKGVNFYRVRAVRAF